MGGKTGASAPRQRSEGVARDPTVAPTASASARRRSTGKGFPIEIDPQYRRQPLGRQVMPLAGGVLRVCCWGGKQALPPAARAAMSRSYF
jgi:hypothetical protein